MPGPRRARFEMLVLRRGFALWTTGDLRLDVGSTPVRCFRLALRPCFGFDVFCRQTVCQHNLPDLVDRCLRLFCNQCVRLHLHLLDIRLDLFECRHGELPKWMWPHYATYCALGEAIKDLSLTVVTALS